MDTEKKKRNPKRLSYKDVQIAYLADGVGAVEKMLSANQTSRTAVRRALDALRAQGAAAATLDAFISTHVGQSGRGRPSPVVGDERDYRAQQVKGGAPFVRLPLDALGVKKGGTVTIRFESDRIVVTKR